MKLVSLDAVKVFLETANNENDDKINGLIDIASEQIEAYCNTLFNKTERTEYFNTLRNWNDRLDFAGSSLSGFVSVPEPRSFMLRACPVDLTADFKVWYDPYRAYPDTSLLIKDTDYVVDDERGRLRILSSVADTQRGLKVTYTGGYTVTDNIVGAPSGLQHAAVLQTIYLWTKSLPDNVGSTTENTGKNPVSMARADAICDEALGLIGRKYFRARSGQT